MYNIFCLEAAECKLSHAHPMIIPMITKLKAVHIIKLSKEPAAHDNDPQLNPKYGI